MAPARANGHANEAIPSAATGNGKAPASHGDSRLSTALSAVPASEVGARNSQEAALFQTLQFSQRLVHCSPDCIKLLDVEGHVVWVSRNGPQPAGIDDIVPTVGSSWIEMWPKISREEARSAVTAARAGRTGAFQAHFPEDSHEPTLWDVTVTPLLDAAGQAQSLLVYSRDVTKLKQANESLQFLANASKMLTDSLNMQDTLDTLLRLIVPDMADWAVINLLGGGGLLTGRAAAHVDPQRATDIERLRGRAYLKPGALWDASYTLGSLSPRIVSHAGNDFLSSIVLTRYLPLVKRLGRGSMMMLSLESADRVLGSLIAVSTQGRRPYSKVDSPLFEELAHRAANAIDHAREHENSKRVAQVFQEASLPESLPTVDGVTFHSTYIPAQTDVQLGGDWYDAFRIPDGRIALSIGDVCGTGVEAAVVMCKVRQTLRSVAMIHPDPAVMLDTADRMVKLDYPYGMVTSLVGILDPKELTFVWAAAGHPGPLFRHADGKISEGYGCGLPLGLRGDDEVPPQTVHLPHGSLVMCYTDGLIESTHDLFEGERRLRAALASDDVVKSANPAKAIHDLVLHDGARDDVAILIALVGPKSGEVKRHREERPMPKKTSSGSKKAAGTRTTSKKSGGRKYGKKASDKVGAAMDEMKQGKLKSGRSGKKVTNPKQAVAIGLSEARKSGAKVPPKKK
ncbi:MAG: SpoIIE family protein phosphatase [Candidatus Eremiobacteraeota bacterium]|nr:SpoIIE family protein phosphatase [Candidatus Eremiobacteraeota bacterium]